METEIVDDDEFAAIEMAMAQAAQRVQAASVNVPALPPNPPARPQSGNASFTQNSGVQAGPRHTPSNPAPCSGPTSAHGSSDSSSGAPQRAAVPQQTHSQTQSTGRNDPQRRTGTLDCFVVNSSNSNGVNGMAPSQNGMAQRQNGISQNRSPCKPLPQANEQQPSGSSTAWNGNAMVVTFKLLEGGKRFSAQCGYNLRVIETFKSCKDRNYDVPTKTWSFGIGTHQELLQKLQDMGGVNVKPLPQYTLKAVQDGAKEEARVEKSVDVKAEMARLPADLLEALMPFQREGVEFAIRHDGRCLVGDEMGLGKTIQAIAIAKVYERDWPLLVVCPSSLRMVWRGELLRWLTDLEDSDVAVVMTGKDKLGDKVTVISYDLVAKLEKAVKDRNFKVVVCDESHFLKSAKAQRTKATTPIIRNARRAVLLTGTPALSKPAELYTQVTALKSNLLPKWEQFAMHFCEGVQGRWGWEANGASNIEELRMVLQRVMIRRLKVDVLTQLPAKRRQQIYVSLPNSSQKDFEKRVKAMDSLKQTWQSPCIGQEERDAAKNEQRQMLNRLYEDTGYAKLAAVDEYVSDMILTGYKFLVFAHHLSVLDGIEATVKNNKTRYIRIDGGTPQGQRSNLVDLFQNDPDVQVAVLSMTAAGQGLTLTAASAVVFAELNWTPGVMIQAEDRAHRIGQQYSVNVHFLLAKGSADDIMWPVIEKKISVVGNTLDGQSNNLKGDTRTIEDPMDDGGQTMLDTYFSWPEPSQAAGGAAHSAEDDAMAAGPSRRAGAGRARLREEEGGSVDDDSDDFEAPTQRGRGGQGGQKGGGRGGGARSQGVPLEAASSGDAGRAAAASQGGQGPDPPAHTTEQVRGKAKFSPLVPRVPVAEGPSGADGGERSRSEMEGQKEGGAREPAPKRRRRVIEVESDDDD